MQNTGTPEIMLIQQSPRVTKCNHERMLIQQSRGLQKCNPQTYGNQSASLTHIRTSPIHHRPTDPIKPIEPTEPIKHTTSNKSLPSQRCD